MNLEINNPPAEYILSEISRVSRKLKILKDSIDFEIPEEPQTLDEIMKSIKESQEITGEKTQEDIDETEYEEFISNTEEK